MPTSDQNDDIGNKDEENMFEIWYKAEAQSDVEDFEDSDD